MKLVIRDNLLISVSRRHEGDTEPDWSAAAPLRGVRLSPKAQAKILHLHSTRYNSGRWADLRSAYLQGAYLQGAYLRSADLQGADLRSANLPTPTMILLASWFTLSDALIVQAMRLDAACHPDPAAFDRWAATPDGPCPYTGVRVQRAVNFAEQRDLWSPGPAPRPYDLMAAILAEQCPEWSAERIAEFEAQFQPAEVTP